MGRFRGGFTLVEVLVSTAILAIFLMATATIVQVGMQSLGEARLISEATRIGQERLELARNLPYQSVGTVGGIPSGPLKPSETVQVHDAEFTVSINVLFIDDSYDGLAPSDLIPTDYKRVKVQVTWSGLFASKQPVTLMTDVSAKGEETDEDVGTLSLRVFDAQGDPLSLANVHIQSIGLDPVIDMTVLTDEEGKVTVPGSPVCINCYRVEVSKDGFTEDRTYAFTEVDNPTKPDLSVLKGQVSEVSFAIDQPSTLVVRATRNKSANYMPFVGAQFRLRGTKEIGTTSGGEPIYKVDQSVVTSTGGLATINDLEWDQYFLEIPGGSTVDIAGTWPFLPISLLPASNQQVSIIVQANTQHSLLVQALDSAMQPISEFEAQLLGSSDLATQSAGTVNQGDWSQVYFAGLNDELYSLSIESTGFTTASAAIDVENDVRELFILETE